MDTASECLKIGIVTWDRKKCYQAIGEDAYRGMMMFAEERHNVTLTKGELDLTPQKKQRDNTIITALDEFLLPSPKVHAILALGDLIIDRIHDWLEVPGNALQLTIPLITSIGGNQSIVHRNHFHCWAPMIAAIGKCAARESFEWIQKTKRNPCAAVVGVDTPYGKASVSAFRHAFEALGGKVTDPVISVPDSTRPTETPLNDKHCKRISEADLVYVTGFGPQYQAVIRQLGQIDRIGEKIITDQSIVDPEFQIPGTLDGMRYVDFPFCSRSSGPESNVMPKTKFGFFVYEALRLILHAWERAQSPKDLAKEIANTKYHATQLGVFLMSDAAELVAPVALLACRLPAQNTPGATQQTVTDSHDKTQQDRTQEELACFLQSLDKETSDINEHNVDLSQRNESGSEQVDRNNDSHSSQTVTALDTILLHIAQQIRTVFGPHAVLFVDTHRGLAQRELLHGSGNNVDQIRSSFASYKTFATEEPCQLSKMCAQAHIHENNAVQINWDSDDLENNDAHRLYVVDRGVKENDVAVLSLDLFLNKHHDCAASVDSRPEMIAKQSIETACNLIRHIKAMILADTEKSARCLYDNATQETKEQGEASQVMADDLHKKGSMVVFREKEVPAGTGVLIDNENDNFIRSLLATLLIFKSVYRDLKYLYIIPEVAVEDDHGTNTASCIVLPTSFKLTYLDLRILINCATRVFAPIHQARHLRALKRAHIQSAIGAIMSRNGSHNIGSHVLSALSHSVGVRPDDRVLYKYIQHRMDYVATVTTDFPTWSSPTWFIRDLMRNFYKQKHLLEYIAASEGLGAYHFQDGQGNEQDGQGKKTSSETQQRGKIIIRIVGTTSDAAGNRVTNRKIIISDQHDTIQNSFEDDFQLAIPGGVVGQQAFYTILENTIRNAAKHSWSDPTTRHGKDNLEITIEFTNVHGEPNVDFAVWDNISKVPRPPSEQSRSTTGTHGDQDSSTQDPVIKKLNDHLCRSLIDDNGALVREAWGLAEMRISAGFLCGRDVGWIGSAHSTAVDIRAECCGIEPHETPCGDEQQPQSDREGDCLSHGHIGYRFSLPKPKEMLVWGVLDVPANKNREWTRQSITVIKNKGPSPEKFNFSYIVVAGTALDQGWEEWISKHTGIEASPFAFSSQLPFRLIVVGESDFVRKASDVGLHWKRFCCVKAEDLVVEDNDPVAFKHRVYKLWLKHLSRRSKDDEGQTQFHLHIQPRDGGGTSGGKNGLITGDKIAEHVIRYHLPRIVEGLQPADDCNIPLMDGIRKYLDTHTAAEMCDNSQGEGKSASVFGSTVEWRGDGYRDALCSFIKEWLKKIECEGPLMSLFLGDEVNESLRDTLYEQLLAVLAGYKGTVAKGQLDDLIEDIRGFALCRTLETAFVTAKSMLEGYEEHIETLPMSYVGNTRSGRKEDHAAMQTVAEFHKSSYSRDDLITGTGISVTVGNESRGTEPLIHYQRHKTIEKDSVTYTNDHVVSSECHCEYIESLSGTQSYLSVLEAIRPEALRDEDISVVVGLVENAFLRCLVVDERMLDFVNAHAFAADVFRGMRIDVARTLEHFPNQKVGVFEIKCNVTVGESINFHELALDKKVSYDVLLIHQGVIDKLLESSGENSVGEFLANVSKAIPFVAITTGRGTPSNTPSFGKILPFSNMESYLFSRHPQKLLVSSLLMSMLPH